MAGEKDARVTVGIDGADEVARAADRATAPWQRAGEAVAGSFKRAGQAISSQLGQVATDMLRTVTVMNALDMRSAVAGARAYREEVARFGVVAGESTGAIRYGLDQISKMTLESEPALAAWSKGVGRLTYDYVGAIVSARALHDESVATGKSFDEMGQLGVVMHNSLGVTDDVEQALGKIRAQAEALGTVGGVAAFQDQIQSLGGVLTGVAAHSDEARDRITALLGMLGKGYSPAQAQQIQSGVLGQLQSRATFISRSLGHDILNEKGEIDDPATVVQELKRHFERVVSDPRTRLTALRTYFGNLAGSAVYRGDFSEDAVSSIAGVAPSRGASRAAEGFAGSDAGRALKTQLEAQRNMRDAAEALVDLQDKWGDAFAEHPLAGQLVGGLMQATMRAATGQLGGLLGGGGAAGGGLGGAGAAGGAAGEGAGLTGFTTGLGSATVALGAFAAIAAFTGKAIYDLAKANKEANHMGLGRPEAFSLEEAKTIRERVDKANAAGVAERSDPDSAVGRALAKETERLRPKRALDMLHSFESAASEYRTTGRWDETKHLGQSLIQASTGFGPDVDPSLRALREGLEAGHIDTNRLPKDIADAIVDALQRSPLKAQVVAGPNGGYALPDKPDQGRN